MKGIPPGELLVELRRMDAVAIVERFGLGVLLLHQSALRPTGPTMTTLSEDPVGRQPLDSKAFLVFPLRTSDPGKPFVSLGRTEANDIEIPDASISRFHAVFRIDGGRVLLHDAPSKHGTFHNGARVPSRESGDPVELRSGDSIGFGSVTMTYLLTSALADFAARLGVR